MLYLIQGWDVSLWHKGCDHIRFIRQPDGLDFGPGSNTGPQAGSLTALCLVFLICAMEMIIISNSQCCPEAWTSYLRKGRNNSWGLAVILATHSKFQKATKQMKPPRVWQTKRREIFRDSRGGGSQAHSPGAPPFQSGLCPGTKFMLDSYRLFLNSERATL